MQHEVHGLERIHLCKQLAEYPDALGLFLREEEIVAAGAGKYHIDRREDSAVAEVAVQLKFHVASALEFLEDDIIHLGTGLGECRGEDGEGTASFYITRCSEEALGLLQGIGIHTTGQNLAGCGLHGIIIICRKTNAAKLGLIKQPFIKDNSLLERESEVPETFDCFGTTSSAKDEINELFGARDYFSTPKPLKLMKELARATTSKNSIVLDFFAGSGTVGQAVAELNLDDHGNRSFVLISNNESDICKKVTCARLEKMKIDFRFLD